MTWNLVRPGVRTSSLEHTQVSKEISLDPKTNPKCKECQSIDIDYNFKKTFGCLVCNKRKNEVQSADKDRMQGGVFRLDLVH